MKLIEDQTRMNNADCLRFEEKTNQASWLTIVNGTDCSSHIGKEAEMLSLTETCISDQNPLIQLFMFVLGFQHEHRRPDRDEWVAIHFDNIRPGMIFYFCITLYFSDDE